MSAKTNFTECTFTKDFAYFVDIFEWNLALSDEHRGVYFDLIALSFHIFLLCLDFIIKQDFHKL